MQGSQFDLLYHSSTQATTAWTKNYSAEQHHIFWSLSSDSSCWSVALPFGKAPAPFQLMSLKGLFLDEDGSKASTSLLFTTSSTAMSSFSWWAPAAEGGGGIMSIPLSRQKTFSTVSVISFPNPPLSRISSQTALEAFSRTGVLHCIKQLALRSWEWSQKLQNAGDVNLDFPQYKQYTRTMEEQIKSWELYHFTTFWTTSKGQQYVGRWLILDLEICVWGQGYTCFYLLVKTAISIL